MVAVAQFILVLFIHVKRWDDLCYWKHLTVHAWDVSRLPRDCCDSSRDLSGVRRWLFMSDVDRLVRGSVSVVLCICASVVVPLPYGWRMSFVAVYYGTQACFHMAFTMTGCNINSNRAVAIA
jgi:hypothetical protein